MSFVFTERYAEGGSLPDAYHNALTKLEYYGSIVDCPDWNTRCKELPMTFIVYYPTAEPRISKLFPGGPEDLEQYRQEMMYGIMDFEVEKGNWDYTYHQRMSNQLPFIIEELKRNPSSRRAVINVRDNDKDMNSNDPACLQNIQFLIRDDRLHCIALFRSNDAFKATFMNAYAIICIQEMIANKLGIRVGHYTHRANSFHCYEKDWPALRSAVQRIIDREDLTYTLKGDWDELMKDSRTAIREKVRRLKK